MKPGSANAIKWRVNIRILHWIIASTVTFQLFSSLFMADQGTQFLFPVHEIIGLIAAGCIAGFWWFSINNHDLPILFPWNRAGIVAALRDIGGLFKGRLPPAGRRVGLSGLVHGLGILALTGSAITGFIIYFYAPMGQRINPADSTAFTHLSLEHKWFGELLWIYWIGHVVFALLHQLTGANIFKDIFGFSKASGHSGKST